MLYKVIKQGIIANGIVQILGILAIGLYATSNLDKEEIGNGLAYLILATMCLGLLFTVLYLAYREHRIEWYYLATAIFEMVFPFALAIFMLKGIIC